MREVYEAQLEKCNRLGREIADFWDRHDDVVSAWRKAANYVNSLESSEFYGITGMVDTPPPMIIKLMTAVQLIWRLSPFDWVMSMNLLGSSDKNEFDGDREACATYVTECRAIFE